MPGLGLAEQIRAAEAKLSQLYSARAAKIGTGKQPEAAGTSRARVDHHAGCAFPPAYNFTGWRGRDVKQPAPWCPVERRHPTPRSLEDLAREGESRKVAVLPSLLVPCCAHSGTTFLWRCMLNAFHPERVCGRLNPRSRHNPSYAMHTAGWTASRLLD